jgi:multidrug efflux pump subunit AcrA (membrane-fusion protein)
MAHEIPRADQTLRTFGKSFLHGAQGQLSELGLTEAQYQHIEAALLAYNSALQEQSVAQAAAIGAASTKEARKEELLDALRQAVRVVRSKDVPSPLLDVIGIGAVERRAWVRPHQPQTLTAAPSPQGINLLRWKAGENGPKTTYLIEVCSPETPEWRFVGATTKCSFRHLDQQPGRQQTYRVTAQRRDTHSIPSFSATVYLQVPKEAKRAA